MPEVEEPHCFSPLLRLLMVCPHKICGCSSKRRTAHTLRVARDQCARLRREAANSGNTSVPIEHIRAASQHLAAIENWLIASRGQPGHLPAELKKESLTKQLGLAGDYDSGDDSTEFMENFLLPHDDEVLLLVLHCLIISADFRYPGRIFVTSGRLCFGSNVMGMNLAVAFPWANVKQSRLMPNSGNSMTNEVRISVKNQIDLDGTLTDRVNIRIFDFVSLGNLHKCLTFFHGAGLFGMWQDDLDDPSPVAFAGPSPDMLPDKRRTVKELKEKLEGQVMVWELQRRTSIFTEDWRPPFLPHDGVKQISWVNIQEDSDSAKYYVRHPYLPEAVTTSNTREYSEPPIHDVEVFGKLRPCTWNLVVDDDSDVDGWQYGVDFYVSQDHWSAERGYFSHVRRRKWQPSLDVSAVPSPDLPAKEKSTILSLKGLNEPQQLCEVELGVIPLEALAAEFEASDWQVEGSLMQRNFQALGAQDFECSEWASGQGAASKVKGKVRSIQMRLPLPPAPMCPPESRTTTTWHVVSSPTKVILESVSMSLDVPYGDYFNVVVCDTFDIVEHSGQTRMVRTCAVDWVKSCWLSGMIESNVPTETTKFGIKWAEIIRQWGQELS